MSRETALLLFTLREPGPLPAYAAAGGGVPRQIAELVADGVLELDDGGRFVSGPEALPRLSESAAPEGEGNLARLSRDALRYAEALELDDIEQLAARLYTFNRIPVTPRWQRRFPDAEAILDAVGGHRVADGWSAVARRRPDDWLGWARQGFRPASRSEPTFKIYVSPAVESLEPAFGALVEVLRESRATYFKLGSNAAGVLRPDKLVVYFDDIDSLSETSSELATRLDGIPAHGVPFSAESAGGGLLSWGMDPPAAERTVPWTSRESWRLWVARRLAAALIAGQRESAAMPPWRFALERLRLAGVDVERWIPEPTLWHAEA